MKLSEADLAVIIYNHAWSGDINKRDEPRRMRCHSGCVLEYGACTNARQLEALHQAQKIREAVEHE